MSKLTFLKRTAVLAVAALGFGLVSVAPSSAVVTSSTLSFDADDTLTLTSTSSDSVTATLTQTFAGTNRFDSATVYVTVTSANSTFATLGMRVSDSSTSSTTTSGVAATSPNITWGGGITPLNSSGAQIDAQSTIFQDHEKNASYTTWSRNDSRTVSTGVSGAASATVKYTVGLHSVSRAGTYTVTASVINYNAGSGQATSVAATATWTVTVTGQDLTAVAANTTSRIYAGEGAGTTDSAVVTTTSTVSEDAAANIEVTQKNAANGTASESMTATLAGPGWLTSASTRTGGTKPTSVNNTKTISVKAGDFIQVWPDGTAGTTTVTITSFSGVVLGTETLTFHGSRAAIAIDTTNFTIGRAGNGQIGYTTGTASATMAATDVAAFVAKVTDSGGRPVSGASVTVLPSNTAIVASGTCAENDYAGNPGNTGGKGFYNCSFTTAPTAKSGDATTLTVRITDPAVTTTTAYITTTVNVTIGGTIATETASFDKATYEPGEKMVYTITAKDSAGNPVYDGATPATLTCNKTIGGSLADQAFGVYVLVKLLQVTIHTSNYSLRDLAASSSALVMVER